MKIKKATTVLLILTMVLGFSTTFATDGIDLYDAVSGIDDVMDKEALEFRINEKDNYDKHYSDDLYFTDFTYEKYLVNKAYEKAFNKYIQEAVEASKPVEVETFIQPNIECYNQTLQEIRDGKITVQDVLTNEKKYVRAVRMSIYYFTTGEVLESYFNEKCNIMSEEYNKRGVKLEIMLNGYNRVILNQIDKSILKDMKYPRLLLNQYKYEFYLMYFDDQHPYERNSISNDEGKNLVEQLKLQEKYGEEFFPIKDKPNYGNEVYAPVNNPSLEFENEPLRDGYLVVKTQEMVSKRLYEILERNDAKDKFVFFTTPTSLYNQSDALHRMDINFESLTDDLDFVNNILPVEPTTTLYYLLENEAEVDYALLKKIIDDYHGYYPDQKGKHFSLITYFIRMDKDKQKIVIDLFRMNQCKDDYFREMRAPLDMTDSIIVRVNHEGFRFMDVYGDKEPYIYMVHNSIEDKTLEEFINDYRDDGIWR